MELATEILAIFEEIESGNLTFEDMCDRLASIKSICEDYIDNYIGGCYEEHNGR